MQVFILFSKINFLYIYCYKIYDIFIKHFWVKGLARKSIRLAYKLSPKCPKC